MFFESVCDKSMVLTSGGVLLYNCTDAVYVSQGGMSVRAEGSGDMALLPKEIFSPAALRDRTRVSVDVLNAGANAAYFALKLTFADPDDPSKRETVETNRAILPNRWLALSVGGEDLPPGKTLADADFITVALPGPLAYADNFRVY
jgi:hypothetical protein